jgi:hypothetical protein
LLGALALSAPGARATPTTLCDPASGTDQFCVQFELVLPATLNASEPIGLDTTLANTSQHANSSEAPWIDHAALTLLASASPLQITPSSQMPQGLLAAGGDGDCTSGGDGSGFANCDAGHGTALLDVSGSGFFDGFHSVPFGISKIVNVNPPPAGSDFAFDATVTFCVPFPNPCSTTQTAVAPLRGVKGAGHASPTVTVPTYFTQMFGNATVNASLGTFSLHILAQSNTLDGGGPADKTYVISRLPAKCGSAAGTASATSHGNVGGNSAPSTLGFPLGGAIVNCPTAAFTVQPFRATVAMLDGSASAAHVAGRTVTKYLWIFGDGTKGVGAAPSTKHEYPAEPDTPPTYTVTLTPTDSAGAIGAPVTHTIAGTAITVDAARTADRLHIEATGRVAPSRAGREVTVSLLRKQPSGFVLVKTLTETLSATSRFSAQFKRPAPATCKILVKYAGDATRLGSEGSAVLPC